MIIITWQQIVAAIFVLFIGMYAIIEYRLKKHEAIVADYIQIREKRTKELLTKMIEYVEEKEEKE